MPSCSSTGISATRRATRPFCGSGGYPPGAQIVTLCTTHEAFHRMFNSTPNYALPVPGGDAPARGTIGARVRGESIFDGWGYAHLYRNDNGKMAEVAAYAIPESLDPRYAFGFGDLSIHEFATDPETNLAYASYYAGGLRVVRFGDERPAGGRPLHRRRRQQLLGRRAVHRRRPATASSRGPIATTACTSSSTRARAPSWPSRRAPPPPPVVKPRPSSFFAFGKLNRVVVSRRQASVTITVPGPGKATARLKASIGGRSVTIARATRTARARGKLKLTFRLSAFNDRLLRRTVSQRRTRRTAGVLQASFTRTGGIQRTRNKSLAIGRTNPVVRRSSGTSAG